MEAHKCNSEKTGINRKADFILTFWMIHEVPDQQKFLEEMKSFLNPGGRFMIAEPKIHVTRKSFNELIKRVEDAGFQIISTPEIAFSRSLLLEVKTAGD
ncbi:MAG: methyltransferase domain-containing protein [Bacteroidales bacterium]|nr:methyltransferase domain-containing protein [Bacteroidales bacterium]